MGMRADWSSQDGLLNHWELAGGIRGEADRFRAVARLTGIALIGDSAIKAILPKEVAIESDPLTRWFTAIRFLTDRFEPCLFPFYGIEPNVKERQILTGSICNVIDASGLLCLQLAAKENAIEDRIPEEDTNAQMKTLTADSSEAAVPKRRGRTTDPRIAARKEITKRIMKSREDWNNPDKIKDLFEAYKEQGSPTPQRRGYPSDRSSEAWDKAYKNRDSRRRVCSTLRRELYPRQSKNDSF
jgi:hypothetical protein